MKETLLKLDGAWSLTLIPNEDVVKKRIEVCTKAQLDKYGYGEIGAQVPGNFELDLVRAGIEPDPYFSQNAWDFQKYENRHLYYSVFFVTRFISNFILKKNI